MMEYKIRNLNEVNKFKIAGICLYIENKYRDIKGKALFKSPRFA